MKLTGKFIGKKKIKEVKVAERKTYLGREVTAVAYEDGSKEELPSEIVETIISEKETDLTALRDKFINPLTEKLIVILLESEIKIQDIEYLKAKLTMTINNHIENADKILWKKEYYDRTLQDVQQVLTKIK